MPAAQTLPALRRELLELLTDDLAAALTALRDLMPEGSDKHGQVLALQARLKDANKERIRNTIAPDEYQRRVDTVRAACYDLIAGLEPADLEPPAAAPRPDGKPAAREGSVLYRVPHRMPLQKPVVCTIRVAMDEDAILEDLVLDDDVRLRPRVEVSDMMRAELLDPDDGAVFAVRPLSEAEQLVREQGYTQWLFRVTPLVTGKHQLLVKVSMMEYNAHLGRYVPREVSVLETVTIVTGEALPDEAEMKATGERVALATAPPTPLQEGRGDVVPAPFRLPSAAMRAVVFALVFLMAGSAGVWAFMPFGVARALNTESAYNRYIEVHRDDKRPATRKRLEQAYTLKAELTNDPADLRAVISEFPQAEKREQILQKLETLETAAFERIRQKPEPQPVREFLKNFPDSKRLDSVAEIAESRPEVWQAVQKELAPLLPERRRSPEQQNIPEVPAPTPIDTEARDWAAVEAAGTARAYEEFVKKYPRSSKLPAARARINALKPARPDRPRSGLEMVPVQGGTFTMGCVEGRDGNCDGDEKPAHPVTLSGFQIGRYEVTQADWREIMSEDPPDLAFPGCDDCPVERVSWNDVRDFLKKLNAKYPGKNYRLPTEAEWEYAALGGHRMPKDAAQMTQYAGGNDIGKVAWYSGNSGDRTHPVGGKVPNALGLYDMSGNVWEWCSDWYGDYTEEAQTNPTGPKTGSDRVGRGGSWTTGAGYCRVSYRSGWDPGYRGSNLGFRVASSS